MGTDFKVTSLTQEELISELEALYRLSADLICVASGDGRFRRLSPNWETALGYPVEELIGRLWMDFVHPEDAQATIETAREMARHDIAEFVNRYRRKDGTWVRLSWRCSAWAGGLTYGIVRVLD